MISHTSAVIMASGFSRRMQKNKLFLIYKKQTFIERTVEMAQKAGFFEVIVVIRPEDYKKCNFPGNVRIVFNRQSNLGQSMSVRLGTMNVRGDHAMFLPIDQPLLTTKGLQKIANSGNKKAIVVPFYDKKPRGPVFFGKVYFKELIQVTGDTGGRMVRDRHKENWVCLEFYDEQLKDIDTQSEYAQLFSKKIEIK
ncbi:nucleotidyltransferase family protein [Tetragenococcus halophilus]|uniref:nucleotidyltransferase family protein n=1 Tax=Tetragenococcus halophilus TaxID=51669 RepID=UPI001F241EE2|nr:NTP transferase domain-containing protein [Tetragenococcus halophilus]MCF1684055.1 nucleotidyltransferase family protein [Tetragenococcus halophilus]